MANPRRSYTREEKLEAVKTLLESGKTQKEVAKEIGINANLLWQWKKLYQREIQPGPRREEPVNESSSSDEVIAVLKRRKAKLEEELHIIEEVLRRYEQGFK